MPSFATELSPEQRDALIDRVAGEVVRRRLETPAVLFLVIHRPLSFLASQALVVFTPLFGVLFKPDTLEKLALAMQERENIDRLVNRIEELANERETALKAEREAADS